MCCAGSGCETPRPSPFDYRSRRPVWESAGLAAPVPQAAHEWARPVPAGAAVAAAAVVVVAVLSAAEAPHVAAAVLGVLLVPDVVQVERAEQGSRGNGHEVLRR